MDVTCFFANCVAIGRLPRTDTNGPAPGNHTSRSNGNIMNQLLTGEVAWYATGRFYVTGNTMQDVGYFLHIQGIDGEIFNGHPHESTAYFTFSSQPFTATKVPNAGLSISLDATGEFSIYLNRDGGASFDNPETFATGKKIATFSRVSVVAGVTIAEETKKGITEIATNAFSASLVRSEPFEFGDRWYDLKDLLPRGITQFGTAGTTIPADEHTSTIVVPFVGSAIAVGKS